METYSILSLIGAAILLFSALLLTRRRLQRQQAEILAREADQKQFQHIELIRVQNPTPQDLQAYELIETERQKMWKSLSINTSIAPRQLTQLSFELVQKIAAIYYPTIETPEFQASISDLLELNGRINARLKEYLEQFPLSTIKDLNIQDILRYKGYYDRVSEFELVKLAKKYTHLYMIGQYAWMTYNAINPWYWGRQVVMTAGREGTFRYLLSVIITVVGEEALLVYSKRNIRARAVAVEKNIAFEMISMAVADGVVSQEEYEVILNFVLNNGKLEDDMKVTLLKALLRKKPVKAEITPDTFDEKDKQRLLEEVERVAKADKLGMLKKREALKAIETSLNVESGLRTKLDVTPHQEVQNWELVQQKRQREEAVVRFMVQAGSLETPLPDALREYILRRTGSYPIPFTAREQDAILDETVSPTHLDTLANVIVTQAEKEQTLTDVLSALLWSLPFTRKKEEFYMLTASSLGVQKISENVLVKRLESLLPKGKLIEKPPADFLKYLYRLIVSPEQITTLQATATTHTFTTADSKPKQKQTTFWLCVTTERTLILTVGMIDGTMYQHHLEFRNNLVVRVESGRLYDAYILQDGAQEIRLENPLFGSANLKRALERYIQ